MAILKVANVHHDASGYTRTQIATANNIQWYTGNSERVRIDQTGNLLIGRTSSSTGSGVKVEINGAANAAQYYVNGYLATNISNSFAQSYAQAVGDGGNVYAQSVGFAGNSYTQTIFGYANAKFLANSSGATFNGDLIVSGNVVLDSTQYIKIWNPAANTLAFFTSASEKGRFDPTGNLLIGRTSSTLGQGVKVDVAGAVNASAFLVNGVTLGSSSVSLYNDSISTSRYLVFANTTSGAFVQANVDTSLVYNPSTNRLDIFNGSINAAAIFVNDAAVGSGGGGGGGGGDFNTGVASAAGFALTTTLSTAVTMSSTSGYRYIVRSIHVTNIGSSEASVTGDFSGGTYSSTAFANTIPIPVGSAVELLKRPKVLNPSDLIRLQSSLNSTLHATISYETQQSTKYYGQGVDITAGGTYTDLYTATGSGVIESILLVNDDPTYDVRARAVWTDGSNNIQGYFCYDMVIPADSSVELLDAPKHLPFGYKVQVYANVGGRLEAMIAGKIV